LKKAPKFEEVVCFLDEIIDYDNTLFVGHSTIHDLLVAEFDRVDYLDVKNFPVYDPSEKNGLKTLTEYYLNAII
jgi:hypothetical protein